MTKQITNLILDMDGVLWVGDNPMPNLATFFAKLEQLGINFVLATNNASKTTKQYQEKLAKFGVEVSLHQILNSAEATASYLVDEFEVAQTAVYTAGSPSLHQTIAQHGFQMVTWEDVYHHQATADVVVVGFSQEMTYAQLAMGSLLVHQGAKLIGTNPDTSFPSPLGPLPGAGSLMAVLATANNITPITIGKPGPIMFASALKRLGSEASNTAMVGDRLNTDIEGGHNAGLTTILLLSGISTRAEAEASDIQPDYIFADINELIGTLETGTL